MQSHKDKKVGKSRRKRLAWACDGERAGWRAMGIEVQDKKRNGRPKRG